MLVGLRCARVHPVLEPPSQLERAPDHVVAVAGQPQLPLDRVHHLLGGRDARRGDQHQERDLVGGGRRERPDPAALADPPEADPLRLERLDDRERVLDLQFEPAAGRVAGRFALAAPVERDDADPGRGQELVQMAVEGAVPRPLAGAVKRDDRRAARRRVARREGDAVVLDSQIFHWSSFGSGRECTSMSRRVGRVSAT